MKGIKIVGQICLLYAFYMIGNFVQNMLDLMIPGSIIGMILLFVFLHIKSFPVDLFKDGCSVLVKHLPLLFIPATVGVMNYFSLFFSSSGIRSVFITIISTVMVMVSASVVSQWLMQKKRKTIQQEEGKRL